MNKFLVSLLAVLFTASASAIITPVGSNSLNYDGSAKVRDRILIKVRNKTGSTIAVGTALYLDPAYTDGMTVKVINASSVVPLCIADEAILDKAFGTCLVQGYSDTALFDSTAGSVSAGGKLYIYSNGRLSTSSSGMEKYDAVALESATASGAMKVYFKGL